MNNINREAASSRFSFKGVKMKKRNLYIGLVLSGVISVFSSVMLSGVAHSKKAPMHFDSLRERQQSPDIQEVQIMYGYDYSMQQALRINR